jgi:acyl-CoA synthetase (AMP-forming)/AMP-acid ligase II
MSRRFVRPHRPLPEPERPPRLRLISDYPAHWAALEPDREAVVFEDARWSYRELAERVDSCARALVAWGIRPGDRVATLAPPSPDFYVTFLATASVGAIWLGLNPRYQRRELEYLIGDARPRLLFARTRIGERDYGRELAFMADGTSVEAVVALDAPGPAPGAIPYPAFVTPRHSGPPAVERPAVAPSDPALIVYTSGTTGAPKGALITHHALIHVARVQSAIWPVRPYRVINNLPINHIGCVGDITCDALVPGGTIVFQEQFDPAAMLAAVPKERITFFGHVPTVLQLLADHPAFATTDFSTVEIIIWEGAAAPPGLIERLRAKCPNLANAYGMSETVGSVTFTFDADEVDLLANSIGWPVPDYQVRIAADDRAVGPGEPGEIQVRGDFVCLGYWNRPDATRDLFTPDGWLRTGDLAVERTDGAYRLIGRLKEMFKSGGYNVYPREVEQVLEAHPDVALAAVIGVPDPLYQEVGHAFVMAVPGRAPTAEELERYCRTQLANYKVPKKFVIGTGFPMLPIGKIDKQALRAAAS